MKKKPRNQPSIPFYSTEPAVSRKLIASTTAVPVGSTPTNKIIPKHPGKLSGVAGFTSKARPRAHRIGHK